MSQPAPTVRELRRKWKPHKERLGEQRPEHPTAVRFHRACSWLQRVEATDPGEDGDLVLTFRWIAFNSLYGQWDEQEQEPVRDCRCWKDFLKRIVSLDHDKRLPEALQDNRRLVMALLEDKYLNRMFWQEPDSGETKKFDKTSRQAQTWYFEERWTLILENVMQRIYLLRSQLMHGAATHNSRLNRIAVRRCAIMLGHLLPAMLLVWADHGAEEDWGAMCYPPRSSPARPPVRADSH